MSEMVFKQNPKIQPQISLSRLATIRGGPIRYRALKRPLTGCDTGVIVPGRGKLVSLPRSSLGYVCMLTHACEHKGHSNPLRYLPLNLAGPRGVGAPASKHVKPVLLWGLLIVLSQ